MQKRFVYGISLFLALAGILSSCELNTDLPENDENIDKDLLHVKFTNETGSLYTITGIELRPRGIVDASNAVSGEWGNNLLGPDNTLAPGETFFFDADIPSGEWSQCRLYIDNGAGQIIILGEDAQYAITHWGSDDRTVGVTLSFDNYSNTIYVSGWSEWAGIE